MDSMGTMHWTCLCGAISARCMVGDRVVGFGWHFRKGMALQSGHGRLYSGSIIRENGKILVAALR